MTHSGTGQGGQPLRRLVQGRRGAGQERERAGADSGLMPVHFPAAGTDTVPAAIKDKGDTP